MNHLRRTTTTTIGIRLFLDFDGALYHITCARDKPFVVSIKLKFFRDLEQHGTDEVKKQIRQDFFANRNLGSSSRIW